MRNFIKKVVRIGVAELYWRAGAHLEDNYAKNYILLSQVPRDTDKDLIVAEMDKAAAAQGKVITRILREFHNGK